MRLVALGASWGGLRAVGRVLAGLPPGFGAPVVVAQHRDEHGQHELLAELLGRRTALPVAEADDKAALEPGRVLLAPSGYHLLVEVDPVSRPHALAELSVDEPVHFSRPSIDVLFESVAHAFGAGAVGAVLTGANADGAAGLAAIVRHGGTAVVQDPDEAERPEMPRAALAICPDARVLPLAAIPAALCELVA